MTAIRTGRAARRRRKNAAASIRPDRSALTAGPHASRAFVGPLVLCLLGLAVYGKDIAISGSDWPDAAVHSMNGALIRDYVFAGPEAWFSPVQFAQRQYARYPSLGLGLHYPPAFATVEAGVFAVLGVSSIASRITVLLFAMLMLCGAYLLLRRQCTPAASLIGASALLAMPLSVLWSRQAMLETPTLACLIWAALLFLRYLDRPTRRRLVAFVAVALLAPLFKQPAVFLLVVLFVWGLVAARRGQVPPRHFLTASLVVGLVMGTFFTAILLTDGHVVDLVQDGRQPGQWLGWSSWEPVLIGLGTGAGLLTWVLAAGGAVVDGRRRSQLWVLALAWLGACVLLNVVVQTKQDRFLFNALLPPALLVGLLADALLRRVRRPQLRMAAAAAVLVVAAGIGHAQPSPRWHDPLPTVLTYREHIEGNMVLYLGTREPDFILAVRHVAGPQGAMVLRGSKLLYTCASDPRYEYEQYADTLEDVERIIESYAPAAIFVEDAPPWNLEPERLARQHLQHTTHYRRAATVNLTTNSADPPSLLHIYLRQTPPNRTARQIHLSIPIIHDQITIDLEDLGF